MPERLMDSISSEEGPETERLLSQLPSAVRVVAQGRRESLTAPPSPTDSRKKQNKHHYMNQLHHLIHWRDIWGSEQHKRHEVLPKATDLTSSVAFSSAWVTLS